MAKEKSTKKSTVRLGVTVGALTILAMVVAVAMSFVFQTREEHITTEYDEEPTGAVVCKAGNPMDTFFETDQAGMQSATATMKVTTDGDEIGRLFYTLEQTYENNEQAKQVLADLSVQFGLYMGKAKDAVGSSFSVVDDNKVKATLLAEWDDLNISLAKPFGLTEDDMNAVNEDNVQSLTRVLREKGYVCEVED